MMKKYYAVAARKIGNTFSKKVFYNGKPVIIEITHGRGFVKSSLPKETLEVILAPYKLTLYKSEAEYRKKVKKAVEKRVKTNE